MNTPVITTAMIAALSLGATLLAQGFNVRPGTWEFTMQMEGTMPAMQGIPPEMRATIEAEMRKPRTSQSCVTAEDIKSLDLGKMDDEEDKDCKTVSAKITPTLGDIVRQCTGDQPRTETAHFEATSPQTMKANITSKSAEGTMSIAMSGRWLNAQCKE